MLKVAIVGKQCAGKTMAAEIIRKLAEPADVEIVKFAAPIYAVNSAMGVGKNRAFMQEFSDLAKKHFGDYVFVDRFIRAVKEGNWKTWIGALVCDDVRYPFELGACRNLGFTILYVEADTKVREDRAAAQGLDFIENHSSENQVESLRLLCDQEVCNNTANVIDFEKGIRAALYHQLK